MRIREITSAKIRQSLSTFWNGGQSNSFLLERINEDEISLPMIEEITGLERIGAKQWLSRP